MSVQNITTQIQALHDQAVRDEELETMMNDVLNKASPEELAEADQWVEDLVGQELNFN